MAAIARMVVVLLFTGCATIVEQRTTVVGDTSRRVVELGVEAPEVERLAIALTGSEVTASPLHPGRCVRRTTTTTERHVLVSRSYPAPALAWAPPVAALAIGLWGLGSGLGILPALVTTGGGQGEVRGAELAVGVVALSTALVWGIVTIARTADSREPLEPSVQTRDDGYACAPGPRASSRVEFFAHGASILRGTTAQTGAVSVPEAAQARLSPQLEHATALVDGQSASLQWSEPALYFVGSRSLEGQLAYLRRFPNGPHAAVLKRQAVERALVALTTEAERALERGDGPAVVLLKRRLEEPPFDDGSAGPRVAALRDRLETWIREQAERSRAEATRAALEDGRAALQRRDVKAAGAVLERLEKLPSEEPEVTKLNQALRELLKAELAKVQKQVVTALQKKRFEEEQDLVDRVTALGGDGDEVSARFAVARDAASVASWRSFLGRCNRISADLQAIDRMGSCDANCQVIHRRVLAAQEMLETQVPALPEGDASRQQVAKLCEGSACGLCP